MTRVPFAALPLLTRFATLAVWFVGWVLFAEFVIDRHGLDRYLPFYRVGNLCPYDLAVIAILAAAWAGLHRLHPTIRSRPSQ
jgi:hypothetical protein